MRPLLPALVLLLATAARAATGPAPAVPLALAVRILAAEDARDEHAELLPRLLTDAEPEVRQRAALALGRIGAPRSVGPLVARLRREPETRVRETICLALGLIARPDATRALVETLARDPVTLVRARAAQALGFVGGPLAGRALASALPPPGRAVDGPDGELVWQITVALFRLKDERGVAALLPLARDGSDAGAHAVAWGLARQKSRRAESALHRLARAREDYVRAWGIRGLGDLAAARASEIVPALADRAHVVRAHAIVAAGASKTRAAVPALIAIARSDADPPLAVEAVHALGRIGDARAVPALTALRAGPGVRSRAADLALARLAVPSRRFLTAAGEHPAGSAGWTIVDWLGWTEALGAHPDRRARERVRAFARLGATPEDPHEVRTAMAATQLAESATKDDLPQLALLLTRADPLVRASVVEAIGKLEGKAALPRFERAYDAALADRPEDARMALVGAAAAMKDAAARPLLTRALADPSRPVRGAAERALAELAGNARPRDLGAVSTGRDLAFYRGVVERAARPPLARIRTSAGTFAIRLAPDIAPLTVENFVSLARSGYFDGQLIPRVVPEFVVQIGDPRGDMSGGPGHTIRCEVGDGTYARGAVGMALSGKDTGGSQFFVMHTRHPHLEGVYTIFGSVESGMDVVDRITKGARLVSVRVE